MKLRRIEIENFRAFAKPLAVEMEDFTALIGQNDVGKSSVLAALTIFLEGEGTKIEKADGSVHGDPSRVRITCEFDELPETVVLDDQFETSLAEEMLLTESGRLRIMKIYDCSKTKIAAPAITINAASHPVDADGASLLPLTITDLRKKAKELDVSLESGEGNVKARIRRAIIERSGAFSEKPADIPVDKSESKTLWEQVLKHLPMCALFVSDRSSSDQDPEAQSPMGVAVDMALREVEADLQKLAVHIERKVQEVATRTLDKLREMNAELATSLTARLKEPNLKWKGLFKYTLASDLDIPMDKRGSGVRRLVLLNFFRAEAERKASDAGHRPIIYAIEEPETAQHPDHQRKLVQALLEIADNGGQVLVSTHAPGLAGEIPVTGLRLIDRDANGDRSVRAADAADHGAFFRAIGERLGLLPDNLVRVLVCVEGANDVRFLKHVSRTLHATDPNLPDLNDAYYALVPMHGGNLRDIVNLHIFKGFHKPEFHIYDRDDANTYKTQADEVNARADGSKAVVTGKRTMENYIHSAALKRVHGIDVVVGDQTDVVGAVCATLGKKKSEVKAIIADEIAPIMTVAEIDERDPQGDIRGWLAAISALKGN